MIYLFRIFEDGRGDYLEFMNREQVISSFTEQRDPAKYHWSTVSIVDAMNEEIRFPKLQALQAMRNLGDERVVRVVIEGLLEWYSPHNSHGIPSEYTVAIKFFTDECAHHQLTTCHHEVFHIAGEPRFQALTQEVIDSFLDRVRQTRSNQKLDRYLDMNLRKLRKYGVQPMSVNGSYVEIKEQVSKQAISCPFFSSFLQELMDVCIEKEVELLGETKVYEKVI
ncbi:hypothetical protein QCB45_03615 [Thiomicrorhabdus sp. ZW0627]|uniref:hypothetical protein n=1 Tax=Thiomicrorhabdus sp. ZW0627 TaxID=3039774 RepID=UPI002436AA76|nr:hypothetical protein [Thiomicrorhabdus sp. ZW0627]MDG6773409.1 hypothetical protein [Thiomicrorhabdus sp. ZW0627]